MSAATGEREAFLDVLRFAAASAVLLFHFGFRGPAHGVQDLAYPELAWLAKYGYLGVELFFMISGYVIPWSMRGRGVAGFCAARLVRLYPTFWLSVALLAAVPPLLGEWRFQLPLRDTLVNLTMLAGPLGSPYLDGVFWTLVTELQFYALVAVAVGAFGFQRLPAALLGWLVIGAGVTAYAKATGAMPVYPGGAYFMYFCFGAACYFLQHAGERSHRTYALLGLSVPLMAAHATHKVRATEEMFGIEVSLPVVLTALAACCAAVFFSRALSALVRPAAAVTFLGGLTYPLYLLHENIGYALLNTLFPAEARWLALACVTALSFVIAAAAYLWFDLPVRRRLSALLRSVTTSSGLAR